MSSMTSDSGVPKRSARSISPASREWSGARARRRQWLTVLGLERGEQLPADVRVDGEGLALRGDEPRAQRLGLVVLEPVLEVLHALRVDRQCAASLGAARVDRGPHDKRHHPLAVEPGADRLAHAADRLLELLALALDLLDVRLEVRGHLVE